MLLFGMLVSRITQLTKDDVIEASRATWLVIDGHRLVLPTKLAHLVRQLRGQDEPRWTLGRLGVPVPWLFPGQSPDRPAVDVLFGVRLHRYGIDAHAGRNTSRLALVAGLPAAVLADLTGISVGRRALVPVGQARLGRLCRPARGRRPPRPQRRPETY